MPTSGGKRGARGAPISTRGGQAAAPSTVARGGEAERRAAAHLSRLGYVLMAVNVRVRGGELDLVARDGDTVCFVEVRSRASTAHGDPIETIGHAKRRRLARAAETYLVANGLLDAPCRFDVVAIVGPLVTLHRDAFRLGELG